MEVICIGEVLFDVFTDQELLAGAPLNVTAHIHRLGHEVAFVTGVGTDEAGTRALAGIEALGLPVCWIVRRPEPTGRVEVEVANGEPSYAIQRGVAYESISLPESVISELAATDPKWMYFGTLAQSFATTRNTTDALLATLPNTKCFYDLNLRNGFDAPELICQLLQKADVAKFNHLELRRIGSICGWSPQFEEDTCRRLASRFGLEGVCVTRGERGAGLLYRGRYVESPSPPIKVVDTVGAGDAFAAALLHGLLENWEPERIVRFGNALGSLVASRRGAIPQMTSQQLTTLINT